MYLPHMVCKKFDLMTLGSIRNYMTCIAKPLMHRNTCLLHIMYIRRFLCLSCTCLVHKLYRIPHLVQCILRCIYSRWKPHCPQVSMNSSDSRHMCLMLLRRL
jgi:hypothetical protein